MKAMNQERLQHVSSESTDPEPALYTALLVITVFSNS